MANPPAIEAKKARRLALNKAFYPEAHAGDFTRIDKMIAFYGRIDALLTPASTVLDFGAGRGAHIIEEPIAYRRKLAVFKDRCAHVDGCDVDPVVLDNPFLDDARVIAPNGALPYEDDRFDVIVARYVLEHVENAELMARELIRVTKPGGWICVATPNRWGYLALAARLVPNRLHGKIVSRVQPFRKEEDVFPTCYRMNTPGALRRLFTGCDVYAYRSHAEPSYHFNSRLVYALFRALHAVLPPLFQPQMFAFIRKRG